MKFTYESYTELLNSLICHGYQFSGYRDWQKAEKSVILRHDVDMCLDKAVQMSALEKEIFGGGAVYFVLLSSDFYNIHSKSSRQRMQKIIQNGGTIGLHFDEVQYDAVDEEELKALIVKELSTLSEAAETKVDVVSMHRPSKKILSSDIEIPEVINSYSTLYFRQMKYLSDSRRRWREDAYAVIESETPHIHLLTHPFWYTDGAEKSLSRTLKEAVLGASLRYYDTLRDNFTDLEAELARTEIEELIGKALEN